MARLTYNLLHSRRRLPGQRFPWEQALGSSNPLFCSSHSSGGRLDSFLSGPYSSALFAPSPSLIHFLTLFSLFSVSLSLARSIALTYLSFALSLFCQCYLLSLFLSLFFFYPLHSYEIAQTGQLWILCGHDSSAAKAQISALTEVLMTKSLNKHTV